MTKIKFKKNMPVRIKKDTYYTEKRSMLTNTMKKFAGTIQVIDRVYDANNILIKGFVWDNRDIIPAEINNIIEPPITFNPLNLVE